MGRRGAPASGLLTWVSEGRRPDHATFEGATVLLAYGARFKALWVAMSIVSAALVAMGVAAGVLAPELEPWLLLVYLAMALYFSAYSLLWLLRALFYRVAVHEWGIEVRLPAGQRVGMRWDQATSISYSRVFDSVVFTRVEGRPLRIMMELDGLEHLRTRLEAAYGTLDPAVAERLSRNDKAPQWV